MRKMTPFKSLTKKQKTFRLVNLALMLLIALAGAGLAIYYSQIGDPNHRVGASIVVIALALAPFLLEMIFRFRFNNVIFLAYQIYFIFAALLGSALDLYSLTGDGSEPGWFDIPVHTLMGYVMCLVGMFLLARIDKFEKFNAVTIALFCFFFSLAVELVWEIGEFACDNLLGTKMQGGHDGVTLVNNTVRDLICNFSGATIFLIHYLVGKLTRLKLGVRAIEHELTTREFTAPATSTEQSVISTEAPEARSGESSVISTYQPVISDNQPVISTDSSVISTEQPVISTEVEKSHKTKKSPNPVIENSPASVISTKRPRAEKSHKTKKSPDPVIEKSPDSVISSVVEKSPAVEKSPKSTKSPKTSPRKNRTQK